MRAGGASAPPPLLPTTQIPIHLSIHIHIHHPSIHPSQSESAGLAKDYSCRKASPECSTTITSTFYYKHQPRLHLRREKPFWDRPWTHVHPRKLVVYLLFHSRPFALLFISSAALSVLLRSPWSILSSVYLESRQIQQSRPSLPPELVLEESGKNECVGTLSCRGRTDSCLAFRKPKRRCDFWELVENGTYSGLRFQPDYLIAPVRRSAKRSNHGSHESIKARRRKLLC